MKRIKSSVRDALKRTMPEAAPFPFEDEFPLSETGKDHSDLILTCAGIALICGMLGTMTALWGNPVFSPAQQALDIQGIKETFPRIGEYLLKNFKEVLI